MTLPSYCRALSPPRTPSSGLNARHRGAGKEERRKIRRTHLQERTRVAPLARSVCEPAHSLFAIKYQDLRLKIIRLFESQPILQNSKEERVRKMRAALINLLLHFFTNYIL